MEQVLQTIIAQVLPIIITAIGGVLVAIIKTVGSAIVDFIGAKKEAVALQMGVDKYNQQLAFAKSIYAIVEENFRLNEVIGDKITQKQQMFDKLLKEKIPYLTDEDLIHLRQAVVGQFNLGKDAITKPAEIVKVEQPQQLLIPVSQEVQNTIAEFHNGEPQIEEPQK